MRPSTIWYTLKQGIKNIKRNWMFSLASIITMAACIFLFGIFFSIVNNVNNVAHKVEQEVPITVFFDEGTTNKQIKAIGKKIKERPEERKLNSHPLMRHGENLKRYISRDLKRQTDLKMTIRLQTRQTTVYT